MNDKGEVVGIISEGDLLHRTESGAEKRHPWWLRGFIGADVLANEYMMAPTRKTSDVMTQEVVTFSPDMPPHEVAGLLEKHSTPSPGSLPLV